MKKIHVKALLLTGETERRLSLLGQQEQWENMTRPTGKYGLKRNELLRIDCQTGEIYGVVKK